MFNKNFGLSNIFIIYPFTDPKVNPLTICFWANNEKMINGTKAITLASRGEPTLHPKLPEMLEYASGKFLEVKLNTNATRLDEKVIRKILETQVNEIVFSAASFKLISPLMQFDQVGEF